MKLIINRYDLKIVTENQTDLAYIEEVLKLKHHGDKLLAMRENFSEVDTNLGLCQIVIKPLEVKK